VVRGTSGAPHAGRAPAVLAILLILLLVASTLSVVPTAVPDHTSPASGRAPMTAMSHAAAALLPATPLATTSPPPNWRNVSERGVAPPSNEGGGLAYDAHSGYAVWAGGSAAGITETFSYLNGTWTNLTPSLTGSPPATPGGMVAPDPALDAVLLVGAFLGAATLGTWAFANGSWSNLTSTLGTGPGFREDGSLAYDPATGQVVLFGGLGIGAGLSDTWVLGAGGWSEASPAGHPSQRWLAGLAFDGADNVLLLEGGVDGTVYYNDTWTWSGTTWTEVAGADAPAGLSVDRDALASAPGGNVVGFGGIGCAATYGVCNQTYEFANGVWTAIDSRFAPSPRFGLQLTYDGHDGYDLAFGGAIAVDVGSNQTWALGGPVVTWLTIEPPVAQPPTVAYFVTTAGGGYGIYSYVYSGTRIDCLTANVSALQCYLDLDDAGNSTVFVKVTDQEGNSSSASAPFDVLLPLYAYDDISAFVADAGEPVNFSVVVDPPSIGVNFTWSGLPPDCPDRYVRNFTCTSEQPGFYAINCLVLDSFGASFLTETYSLNVSARPSIVAWPDRTSGNAPLPVQFDSILTGGTVPFTYNWSFGDGGTSTLPDPLYTYTTAGSFSVSLRVTDGAGVVTNWSGQLAIEVGANLGVVITDSATVWTAPASVQLSETVSGGVGPYTYAWTLGNGATSTDANLTANYTAPGAYTISLSVTDHDGLVASTSTVIAVLGPSGSSGGGPSGGIAPWAAATIGGLALIGGLVAGVWYGENRRSKPEPEVEPNPIYRED
jgi:PKD repeat protein